MLLLLLSNVICYCGVVVCSGIVGGAVMDDLVPTVIVTVVNIFDICKI